MKTILKPILYALVFALPLAGCSESENLNLAGYPKNSIELSIVGLDEPQSMATYELGYDPVGELEVKSDSNMEMTDLFSQTFEIKTAIASPEKMVVHLEPYLLNVPADQVEISDREVVIESGYNSAIVTVRYTGNDYSFIKSVLDAQKFELGVRILDVNGYQIESWMSEAKVVADKEAYVAGVLIVGAQGNTVKFDRSYCDGEIVNEDKMIYTFKVQLDKPARAAVNVSFAFEGLPNGFQDDMTLSPSSVIIAAGETESEEITWSLEDAFLLTNAEEETHTLTLTAVPVSTDPTVKPTPELSVLTFNVNKVFNILKFVGTPDGEWSYFDRTGWTAIGGNGGFDNPLNVLDDSIYTGYGSLDEQLSIAIDMQEEKHATGMYICYFGKQSSAASKKIKIESSVDGVMWKELGVLDNLPMKYEHYIQFATPVATRHLKFISLDKYAGAHYIGIIKIRQ